MAVEAGEDVNEVEAAGNTPLHCAAYEGWLEGVELLLSLGAKVNASNNAGDRPWHWARNMGHTEVIAYLEKVGRQAACRPAHLPCLTTLTRKGHCPLPLGMLRDQVLLVLTCASPGCGAERGQPRAGPGACAGPHPQGQGELMLRQVPAPLPILVIPVPRPAAV